MDNIIEREEFLVPTPDGAILSVTVCRPLGGGPLPALLTYTPYRVSTGLGGVDLLSFAKHDYATVIYDVRGTGDSSGVCDSVYSDDERADGLFMIDWVATQPWCNGKVGMWGISYGAIISLQMAAEAPVALKAIIARSGSDDPFAEWTNLGGSVRNYIYESYSPFMTARNFAPPSPEIWGDAWEKVWQERLEGNVPWGISFAENLEDGKYWRDRAARPKLSNIKCPVFVVEGWSDWYSNPMLRIFSKLNVPKRALIGPWGHQWPNNALPGPRIDWETEALQWWDYWLKDIDNGIMETPPVTLFVNEYMAPSGFDLVAKGRFHTASDYPIPEIEMRKYFFDIEGSALDLLPSTRIKSRSIPYSVTSGNSAGKVGGGPFRFNVLRPLDQRREAEHSIIFVGAPSASTELIMGNPRIDLYCTSDRPVAQVTAVLSDLAPDGSARLISRAVQNLTYRDYPNDPPSTLEIGKTYHLSFELVACAYELLAGHRLQVALYSSDILATWPVSEPFTLTVYSSSEFQSSVTVPINASGSESEPSFRIFENDLSPALPDVRYSLTEDLVSGRVGYQFESLSVFGNTGRLEVSPHDPGEAKIEADSTFECEYLGKRYIVKASTITRSDSTHFTHEANVKITANGEEIFDRNWSTTQERKYF